MAPVAMARTAECLEGDYELAVLLRCCRMPAAAPLFELAFSVEWKLAVELVGTVSHFSRSSHR